MFFLIRMLVFLLNLDYGVFILQGFRVVIKFLINIYQLHKDFNMGLLIFTVDLLFNWKWLIVKFKCFMIVVLQLLNHSYFFENFTVIKVWFSFFELNKSKRSIQTLQSLNVLSFVFVVIE